MDDDVSLKEGKRYISHCGLESFSRYTHMTKPKKEKKVEI